MAAKRIHIKPGQRFGNCVTVSPEPYQGKTGWWCRCDCGEEFLTLPTRLNSGTTTSCGPCKKKLNAQAKVNDLAGMRFGRLVVLSRQGSNKDGAAQWLCQCDCGSSPKVITGKRLTIQDGPTRSCGCISKDNVRKRQIRLEGEKFGLLEVIRYFEDDFWECRCQCGEVVKKKGQNLRESTCSFHCGSPVCAAEADFIGPVLSRADAKSRGLKRYSPGVCCVKGHRGSFVVSSMSCVECHNDRTIAHKIENPEAHKEYRRKSQSRPEAKARVSRRLKERRETEVAYRFVQLIRTRIGKVLRTLKLKKDSAYNRSNHLRDTILELMERQRLETKRVLSGEYELDHIVPLAAWTWSVSHTANRLTEQAANSACNLQFLTVEEHRKKTRADFKLYKWREEDAGYEDHTDRLRYLIEAGEPLPEHLRGHEEIILTEILAFAEAKSVLKEKN